MQLGTTDLPLHSAPLQVGSELEDFFRLLHDSYGVKFVCVYPKLFVGALLLPLTKTRYLQVVLEPIPYAIYWGHRGFWKARHDFFVANGVHLNSKGQYKLYRSFRGAVLKSMQLLSSAGIQ